MNAIVARIYELISKSGINKVKLAEKIGVSRNTIQNWKKEDSLPSIYVIERLCETFNITVEQFFAGIDIPNIKSDDEKFLESWRLLSDEEKCAVDKVIVAFNKCKAVHND